MARFRYAIVDTHDSSGPEYPVTMDLRYGPVPQVGQYMQDIAGRDFVVRRVPLGGYEGVRCVVVLRPVDPPFTGAPQGDELETSLRRA
jgi:hypothetical protein